MRIIQLIRIKFPDKIVAKYNTMNIIIKDEPIQFNSYFKENIKPLLFENKYFRELTNNIYRNSIPIYDSSIINYTDTGWILIIHSDTIYIYGNNWTASQFREIYELFDLKSYGNYTISGDYDLISEIIESYEQKPLEIRKQRLLYKTTAVKNYNHEDVSIRLGNIDDLDELATMLQSYYHEEYEGTNDKTIDEARSRTLSLIQTNAIYVLENKHQLIISFCTIIDPDVGILFTKKGYRNRGYGKVIMSYCSSILFKKNNVVFTMTDKGNVESNKLCSSIGFDVVFEWAILDIV